MSSCVCSLRTNGGCRGYVHTLVPSWQGRGRRSAEHEASPVAAIRFLPTRCRLRRMGHCHRQLHGAKLPQGLRARSRSFQRRVAGENFTAHSGEFLPRGRTIACRALLELREDPQRRQSPIAALFLHGASEDQRDRPRLGANAVGPLTRPSFASVGRCSIACRSVCKKEEKGQ